MTSRSHTKRAGALAKPAKFNPLHISQSKLSSHRFCSSDGGGRSPKPAWHPNNSTLARPAVVLTKSARSHVHVYSSTGAAVRPFGYRGKSSRQGSDSVENLNIFSSAKIVILRCRGFLKSTYRYNNGWSETIRQRGFFYRYVDFWNRHAHPATQNDKMTILTDKKSSFGGRHSVENSKFRQNRTP
jgi:hypothetical protein